MIELTEETAVEKHWTWDEAWRAEGERMRAQAAYNRRDGRGLKGVAYDTPFRRFLFIAITGAAKRWWPFDKLRAGRSRRRPMVERI